MLRALQSAAGLHCVVLPRAARSSFLSGAGPNGARRFARELVTDQSPRVLSRHCKVLREKPRGSTSQFPQDLWRPPDMRTPVGSVAAVARVLLLFALLHGELVGE